MRLGVDAVVHEGAMVVEERSAGSAITAMSSANGLPSPAATISVAAERSSRLVASKDLFGKAVSRSKKRGRDGARESSTAPLALQ